MSVCFCFSSSPEMLYLCEDIFFYFIEDRYNNCFKVLGANFTSSSSQVFSLLIFLSLENMFQILGSLHVGY